MLRFMRCGVTQRHGPFRLRAYSGGLSKFLPY